jgi:hypothetical protein
LRPYGIRPLDLPYLASSKRGYKVSQFTEAFASFATPYLENQCLKTEEESSDEQPTLTKED